MSLIVYPYIRDLKTGQMTPVYDKLNEPFNEMFGFETWRQTVWGSNSLKKLNCKLLNSLSYQDIYAEDEEIHHLRKEIHLTKYNILNIIEELDLDLKSFEFRLDNGLEAIRIAQNHLQGGVYIG